MAGYGYAYRSVSSYSTIRNGSGEPAVIKPFAPFVPKNNSSNYSEGAVTKKIIVPVTSRPYDKPAAEKYASSGDESEDELHHQTIPVHSSPRKGVDQFPAKVQQNHEGGRNPQRLGPGPIVDRGRHSPQPSAEGRKPIGISPIKNDGTNGSPNLYKEGRKPIGGDSSLRSAHDGYDKNGYGSDKGQKPIENSIKNENYDSPKRYDGDHRAAVVGDSNPYKEGRKPIGTGSIRSAHDGYNNGYGGEKERRKPIESNIKNGKYEYDSPNRYGGDHRGAPVVGNQSLYKEGHKPIGGGHDGYNSGYSGDREGYKPIIGSNIQKGYYDSPNGYGGDYKEGHKPIGGGNIQNDYYGSPKGYGSDYNQREGYKPMRNGNYVPKISSDWSAAPRKGIQLSEPTHDIDKAMDLLRIEAAKRDQHYENNNDHHHYYDSPSPNSLDNWGAAVPGNGSPRYTDRTGSAGIMRPNGNVNQLQSRPRNSPIRVTFVDDGRDYDDDDDDYYRRGDVGRYGYRDAVIDSREAEKKFRGTRV